MDLEQYREQSHAIWEKMAAGWERRRDYLWNTSHAVGERMVAKLEPQPGQTILELACGLADTGFAAAAALGDDGKLIATDFSPEMLENARDRARELGIGGNVEFRVMDAEKMDLGDDSVDGVLCRWGYMLMADPAAAMAETRRVLRDGGRLCFSVWGPPERNQWSAIAGAAVVGAGHMPPPEPGAPGIFALGDPERIRPLVTGAGFDQPEIEELELEWRFDSFDEYWRFVTELAGACALVIRELSDENRTAVQEAMRESAAPFERDGAYAFPALVLNVVAS
jgi:ubiquinone/menaquinone biosynthesis C-methylase UbiE